MSTTEQDRRLRIFLCHAVSDKPKVRDLNDRLRDDGFAPWFDEKDLLPGQVWREEIPQMVRASHAVLVCLSKDSVSKEGYVHREIRLALDVADEKPEGTIYIIPALLEDGVRIPNRLSPWQRVNLFQPDGYQRLFESLDRRRKQVGIAPTQPGTKPSAYLPNFDPETFIGRTEHLTKLQDSLLSKPGKFLLTGEPGSGKSTLAQMFASQVQKHFDSVVYQSCGQRSVELIVGELADILKEEIGEQVAKLPAEEKLRAVKDWLQQRRSLLVLDDIWLEDAPVSGVLKIKDLLPDPSVSVLFTSRRPALPWVPVKHRLFVEAFTPSEVEDTFRLYLGTATVERYRDELLRFAERAERLPLAVTVGAQLLQEEFGPLDEAARGLELSRLCNSIHNVPDLLGRAIQAQGEDERRLLSAAAVCSAEDFWLPLAGVGAGLEPPQAAAARNRLVNAGLLRLVGQDRQRFHLHSLLREQVRQMVRDHLESLHENLAQTLEQMFDDWESRWKDCRECLPEIIPTGQWLFANGKTQRAATLMYGGFRTAERIGELELALQIQTSEEALWLASPDADRAKDGLMCSYGNQAVILKAWGRLEEALALCKKQEAISDELGNQDALQRCYGNQAVILRAWGRPEEALALHKKEEAICEALGNNDGLQSSFGNQAVILHDWGRMEEALSLLKKQEAICEELGNTNGLQFNYTSQALILKAWGRQEEALRLLKRQEEICEQLGNRDGLQMCYGNQALILRDWGRLEDALALLKQEEAICEELSNKNSLQIIYCNQALILRSWGRLEEALALLKKQEEICEELGNKNSLSASYGNQALILLEWGQLDEAQVLLWKQETICKELGNQAILGDCYRNWGLLAHEMNDNKTAAVKLEAALAIFTTLKMPRERDAVQAALASVRRRSGLSMRVKNIFLRMTAQLFGRKINDDAN